MLLVAPIVFASLLYADVQIQQVVPDTTIAVFSTNNVGEVIDHLNSAGVCETMLDMCSSICGESYTVCDAQCTEMLNALGIDKETWTPPSGHAGIAIYPVVDYEVGSVGIGLLGIIELDESTYEEIFSTKLDTYLSESELEIESVNLSGRDVWMIQNDLAKQIDTPSFINSGAFDQWYFVFSDGYFIVGSEPNAIAIALLAIDGDFENDMLDSNEDYISLVDRCGNEGDVFAGVLLTNLADTIIQMDKSGMSMMFLATLKSIFGDVDGIAESVSIAPSSDVLVDAKYTALMNDGRSGLLGLLGANATQQPIPEFVQPEVVSYTQGQINLDKFVALIKESIQNNPLLGMQMAPQMEQMEVGLNLFFNPLGSNYHSFSTGQLPFDKSTIGYLFAIECTDEEAFENALFLTLPAAGAAVSDFLGNQIYTVNIGDILPLPIPISMDISIAVGGGYALIGTTNTIEAALRTIANPTNRKRTHATNAATSYIQHDEVSSWGYGDLRTSIEIQTEMSNVMREEMFEEMEAFDPVMALEMRNEFEENFKIQTAITNALLSMLGPMAWNLTADDTGLNGHAIMLKPEN
ncbi:MAG TPA: hypothetical protein EYO40_00040 [Phycisphaerales bacterium]|nr:hypothetical protein [Phycisphaerales bacterium]